ncbi:MAG: recombinase family protein [Clostridiales bacterium]|jgi:DNA invertase Pin-like site-specific DNA recombinase|nr:recombinase family protein [Clostridiales bacterium]
MKNAIIYARYSSERQTEQSIEGQLRVCKDFAEKNDYRIVGIYIDRAMTGRNDNREDFQHMIKDSAKRLFNFVIVYKLDRFARNRYDSAINKAILKKNGVKVLSACEQITDSPEGIILESMLEGYAEYYSAELSQKVKRGLKESRIKGNFTGGFLLYGYKVVDKKWQIDETQANIVRQMYKDYNSGMKLKDIADKLNVSQIRTNTGKEFTVNIVSRLLHNQKYIGIVSVDTEYTNIVPAIVDKSVYDETIAKLDINKHRVAMNKAESIYLLSGKLYCGHCNTLMSGESGTSKTGATHHYYKCFKRKKTQDCDKKSVKKDIIEKKVVNDTIKYLFEQPKALKAIAENMAVIYNNDLKDKAIFDSLLKQKQDKEKAINNLLKALEMGIFTLSTKQRLEELENSKQEIDTEILIKTIYQAKPVSKETIYNYFCTFKDLDYSIQKNRERLTEMFVRKVVLFDDGTTKIYYNISDENDKKQKESADSETEFGFGAHGGGEGNRTPVQTRGSDTFYILSRFFYCVQTRH